MKNNCCIQALLVAAFFIAGCSSNKVPVHELVLETGFAGNQIYQAAGSCIAPGKTKTTVPSYHISLLGIGRDRCDGLNLRGKRKVFKVLRESQVIYSGWGIS